MPKKAGTNSFIYALLISLVATPFGMTSKAADLAELETTVDNQNILTSHELDDERAKGVTEWFTINDSEMDAKMSGNTVAGSTNGSNSVNQDSFSNSSGFATVIQNSGNHVIIQNSTIVNLTLEK